MRIIGNIFKIITLIILLSSSSCGLLSTYIIVKEQIHPAVLANDGYKKGYDYYREATENCLKPETLDIDDCMIGIHQDQFFFSIMFLTFAIGGNICLLILISWWYFRRRKRKKFSRS